MNRNQNILISILLSIIVAAQLIFLYFIKYNNQGLSVSEFSFSGIGNVFNLIAAIVLIAGLLISSFKKKSGNSNGTNLIFAVITSLLLAFAYYSTITQLPFDDIYFLGQHGNRLFTGLMFSLYLYTYFIFLSLTWFRIFDRRSYILLRSLLTSVLMLFILICFAFYYVSNSDPQIDNEQLKKNNNNIAVVLGAAVWSDNKPSPILAARVDKALKLLNNNFVSKIHFTGSNAPGEISEAEAALNYALSKNTDINKLLIENETTSTNEQIHFIKRELLPRDDIDHIIIVSDKFHLVRIEEISKFNNIKIFATQSELKLDLDSDIYNRLRESIGLLFFWFFAI